MTRDKSHDRRYDVKHIFRGKNLLSAGSVDNKFAICAAEPSKPSKSSGASSESSPTSNPVTDHISIADKLINHRGMLKYWVLSYMQCKGIHRVEPPDELEQLGKSI